MLKFIFKRDIIQKAFRNEQPLEVPTRDIIGFLRHISAKFPEDTYLWLDESLEGTKAEEHLTTAFRHHRMLVTLGSSSIDDSLGYVELQPTLTNEYKTIHDTWLVGQRGGICHGSLWLKIVEDLSGQSFQYELNSLARCAKNNGLISRRIPWNGSTVTMTRKHLYTFVGQHYKKRWLLFLLWHHLRYHNSFPLGPFIKALFQKKRTLDIQLSKISKGNHPKKTVDVIIPTLHRVEPLHQVLKDLSVQTLLPSRVIIVEQDDQSNAVSKLDYLDQEWPFEIVHEFTSRSGACAARNTAMGYIISDYVFFADDDIRIPQSFLDNGISSMQDYHTGAMTFSCLRENETEKIQEVKICDHFGSGCSIVEARWLDGVKFDIGFENGYGEDNDFGMQLRKKGCSVLYNPDERLIHLKAPTGGFRTPNVMPWQQEAIQPKPSPTILLFGLKHYSLFQKRGYKTLLFLQFYSKQTIKNPFRYFKSMNQRWNVSQRYAQLLKSSKS